MLEKTKAIGKIDTHIVDAETVDFDDLTIGSVEVVNTSPVNTPRQQNYAYDIGIVTRIVDPETAQYVDFTEHSPANTQNAGEHQSNGQIVAKCESNNNEKGNHSNITDRNTNSAKNEISNVAIKYNIVKKENSNQKLKKNLKKEYIKILPKPIKSNIEEKIKTNLQIIAKNNNDIASNNKTDTIKTQYVCKLGHQPRVLNPILSEFLKINTDKEDTPKCMDQSKSLDDKFTVSRLELLKEWLIEPKATITQQRQRLFKYITSKINLNEIEESEFQVKIFVVYISYQISELLAKCRGNLYAFYDKNTDWLNGSPKKFTPKDQTRRPSNIQGSPHQVKSNFPSQVVLETNDDLFKFIKSSDPPFKPEPLFNFLSSLTELTGEHTNKLMDFCKRYACDAHFKWMTANSDNCKFLTKFEYWLQLKPRFPGFIPDLLKEHYPSVKQDPKTHLRPLEQALLKCTDVPKDLSKVIHRFVHHPEDSERITAYISKFECNCESESCDTPSIKLEDEGLENDPLALDVNMPFEVTNPMQTRDRIVDVSQVMQKLKCLSERTVEPSKLEFGPVLDQFIITKEPLPVKTGTKVFLPGSKIGMVAQVSNIKTGTVIVPISKSTKGVKVKRRSNIHNSVTTDIPSSDDESDEETDMTASSNNNSEETRTKHKEYGPSSNISKTSIPKDNLLKTQDTITVVEKLPPMLTRPIMIDITSALTGQSTLKTSVTNSTDAVKMNSILSILNDKKRIAQLARSCNLYNAKLRRSMNDKTNAVSTRPCNLKSSMLPAGKSIATAGTPETLKMKKIEKTSKASGKVPLILRKSIAVKQLLSDIDTGHVQQEKSKINNVTNTALVNMSLNEFRKRVTTSSLDIKSEPPYKKKLSEIDQLLENASSFNFEEDS